MNFETYEIYKIVDSMFDMELPAEEVIEAVEDHDYSRMHAIVFTQYWLEQHNRKDEFVLNCTEAERFFNPDGTLRTELYLSDYDGSKELLAKWDVRPVINAYSRRINNA